MASTYHALLSTLSPKNRSRLGGDPISDSPSVSLDLPPLFFLSCSSDSALQRREVAVSSKAHLSFLCGAKNSVVVVLVVEAEALVDRREKVVDLCLRTAETHRILASYLSVLGFISAPSLWGSDGRRACFGDGGSPR